MVSSNQNVVSVNPQGEGQWLWTGTAPKSSLVLRRLWFLFRGRNTRVGSLTGKPAVGSSYRDIGEKNNDTGADTEVGGGL